MLTNSKSQTPSTKCFKVHERNIVNSFPENVNNKIWYSKVTNVFWKTNTKSRGLCVGTLMVLLSQCSPVQRWPDPTLSHLGQMLRSEISFSILFILPLFLGMGLSYKPFFSRCSLLWWIWAPCSNWNEHRAFKGFRRTWLKKQTMKWQYPINPLNNVLWTEQMAW